MPCLACGSDMPLAVYSAQNRRGVASATSLPIASSTGNASGPRRSLQERASIELKRLAHVGF